MLVHEYLSNGTLAGHLQYHIAESNMVPWLTRLDIAIDSANALDYLHSYGIIHSDITSGNILLDNNSRAKVSNFLLSRKLPEGVSSNATHVTGDIIGTCGYIDPEYEQYGWLSLQSDVYSFGVVLLELISSKLVKYWEVCDGESLATMLRRKIQNQSLEDLVDPRLGFQSDPIIKKMITAVVELATRCLQCPQELRPNMGQVLETLHCIRQEGHESPKKGVRLSFGPFPLSVLCPFFVVLMLSVNKHGSEGLIFVLL